MAPVFEDQVDMASVTSFNEHQVVYAAGCNDNDLTIFSGKKFSIVLVIKGLFALKMLIEQSPEIVQSFVYASIHGCRYAYFNPEKTAMVFVEKYPSLNYENMLLVMNGFKSLNA